MVDQIIFLMGINVIPLLLIAVAAVIAAEN